MDVIAVICLLIVAVIVVRLYCAIQTVLLLREIKDGLMSANRRAKLVMDLPKFDDYMVSVAQEDRAVSCEGTGYEFESRRAP